MFRNRPNRWLRVLPPALFVLCIPLALLLFSGFLGDRADRENLAMTEESIRRAAVECYALEGAYPPSLDCLTGRYGVTVDTGRYFVDYRYVAANLLPDITVLPR